QARMISGQGRDEDPPAHLLQYCRQYRHVRDCGLIARRSGKRIGETSMRKSNFALRLQPSLLDEARKVAESEGVALNQLINVAVAEKVSALRTERYIAERAARANVPKALAILKRAGTGNRPQKGDELARSGARRKGT